MGSIYVGTISLSIHNISKMSNLMEEIYERLTDSNLTGTFLFYNYFLRNIFISS